jgi:hypothetical protein
MPKAWYPPSTSPHRARIFATQLEGLPAFVAVLHEGEMEPSAIKQPVAVSCPA